MSLVVTFSLYPILSTLKGFGLPGYVPVLLAVCIGGGGTILLHYLRRKK